VPAPGIEPKPARLKGLVLAEDPDLSLLKAMRGQLMPHAAKPSKREN
jgi:hypothetical protein